MVGFEKALRAVKVIKGQIQYRSQSLLNLARGYFSDTKTLIDHMATNRPDAISHSGVIACGISDHGMVYLNRSMRLTHIK